MVDNFLTGLVSKIFEVNHITREYKRYGYDYAISRSPKYWENVKANMHEFQSKIFSIEDKKYIDELHAWLIREGDLVKLYDSRINIEEFAKYEGTAEEYLEEVGFFDEVDFSDLTEEEVTPTNTIGLEDIGSDLKLTPYGYQKEIIKFCTEQEKALIVSPCGSGRLTA